MSGFVKSRNTKATVESSRAELNKVLTRYGCTAFGYEQTEEGITRVTFRVPNSPAKNAAMVPIRLEVRKADVFRRLYDRDYPLETHRHTWAREIEQAERVAWRHLILWIDAACTAATAGLTTIEEAFFAHRLVQAPDGTTGRMIDYVQTLSAQSGGPRLLGSGS